MQEKRRILRLILSNSVWKDGRLDPAYKKPFDFLAENNQMAKQKRPLRERKTAFLKTGSPS
jgi:hypothetical protein